MIWLALKAIFGRGHVLVLLEFDEDGMPYVCTGKRNREFVKNWLNRVVIDCGDGKIATVGPRGGGLRVHNLKGNDDGCA